MWLDPKSTSSSTHRSLLLRRLPRTAHNIISPALEMMSCPSVLLRWSHRPALVQHRSPHRTWLPGVILGGVLLGADSHPDLLESLRNSHYIVYNRLWSTTSVATSVENSYLWQFNYIIMTNVFLFTNFFSDCEINIHGRKLGYRKAKEYSNSNAPQTPKSHDIYLRTKKRFVEMYHLLHREFSKWLSYQNVGFLCGHDLYRWYTWINLLILHEMSALLRIICDSSTL